MTSQTPIIQQTEWYGLQKPCFDRADELAKVGRMTKCIVRDHPNIAHGVKQYSCLYGPQGVLDCQPDLLTRLLGMGDQHMYEMIRADRPVRCYLDIDFVRDDDEHERVLEEVLSAMNEFTSFAKAVVTRCVRPSKPQKGSFHVVYPDKVFATAHGDGLNKFMLVFRQWCREHRQNSGLLFDPAGNFVVDTAVYTRNRVMRLLGNSKRSDPDRATLQGDASGDGWMIQPPTLVYTRDDDDAADAVVTKWYPEGGRLEDPVNSYQLTKVPEKKGDKKNNAKMNIKPVWTPVKAPVIRLLSNEDFLVHLDSRELKARGFEEWFMPVVASLASTVDRAKLAQWCSTSKVGCLAKYGPLIDSTVGFGGDKWESGSMAMRVLRKKRSKKNGGYYTIVDLRERANTHVNYDAASIEATAEGGWEPLNSNVLYKKLTDVSKGDNRSDVQAPRRCFFITGKMGSSKTTSILRYAEHQLRTGRINSVLYVCPRTVLCAQTSRSFEEIHRAELSTVYGRMKLKRRVEVGRYYSGSAEDANKLDYKEVIYATLRGKREDVGVAQFDCCVVNSIHKVPLERYDMVLSDEPVVNVGNFYMDYEAHGGDREDMTDDYTPIDYSYTYVTLVRRAQRVLFVDAAFSQNVLDLCTAVYSGAVRKATREEIELASEAGGVVLPASDQRRSKALKSFVINQVDGEDTPKRLSEIRKYAVFDPTLERPIFEKLVEYNDWDSLMAKLNRAAYKDLKIVVYCSTAVTARGIIGYMRANPPSGDVTEVPKPALVTADTFKQDGRAATIQAMKDAQIAIVTSGLGIGSSFPLPNMFDGAFGFYDYKDDTPHMDDLVQLSGRVRATTHRTLYYAVRSSTSGPCSNYVSSGVNKNPFLMPRADTVDDVPRLLAKAYYDRKALHSAMCTFPKMARELTRDALVKAFSHARDGTLDYSRPSYRLNTSPPPRDLPARQRRVRKLNNKLDSRVKDESMLYTSTKRPHRILRGDLMEEDYGGEVTDIPDCARKVGVKYNPGGFSMIMRDKRKRRAGGCCQKVPSKRSRLDSEADEEEGGSEFY
jgi:hypothetical protein